MKKSTLLYVVLVAAFFTPTTYSQPTEIDDNDESIEIIIKEHDTEPAIIVIDEQATPFDTESNDDKTSERASCRKIKPYTTAPIGVTRPMEDQLDKEINEQIDAMEVFEMPDDNGNDDGRDLINNKASHSNKLFLGEEETPLTQPYEKTQE